MSVNNSKSFLAKAKYPIVGFVCICIICYINYRNGDYEQEIPPIEVRVEDTTKTPPVDTTSVGE